MKINRKFVKYLGIICLVPAFFSLIAFGLISVGDIPLNTFSKIMLGVGAFTFLYFVLAWAFLFLSDKKWWASAEGLENARQNYYNAELKYRKATEELSQIILQKKSE